MRNATKLASSGSSKLSLLAALAALVLAACGGSDEETISASFELTEEAPAGFDDLSGEAELTRGDDETTVSIELTGLEPETEFVSHLHFGGCTAPEVGGPHFKFDLGGSDEPPNEIHMMFESDPEGAGEAEATADREVPDGEAGSVVLHLASEMKMAAFVHDEGEHKHPDKIACAELEGTSEVAEEAAAKAEEEEGDSREHEHGDSREHDESGSMEHDHGDSDSMEHDRGETDSMERGKAGSPGAGPTIVIADGEPVDGVTELEYSAGDQIEFTVESDLAAEIHVHGYDISENVPAGGSVTFSFPAEIEGIFEVELEEQGIQIAELRVNP